LRKVFICCDINDYLVETIRLVAIALFALLPHRAAIADEPTEMVMRTFSVISVFWHPPWSADDESFLEESQIFRNQTKTEEGTDFFIWETIPKGESFGSWSKLYAINAEYPITGEFKRYVTRQVGIYESACSDSQVLFFDEKAEFSRTFIVYCASYREEPELGELAFFSMKLLDQTLVKNYYHVRVPSFDLENTDNLPLSLEEVVGNFEHVRALRVLPNVLE